MVTKRYFLFPLNHGKKLETSRLSTHQLIISILIKNRYCGP